MGNVVDLDILRPEAKPFTLDKRTLDIGFIPCGITFDLQDLLDELSKIDPEKLTTNRVAMKKGFDLAVKMCALFATVQYKDMDEKWFRDNTVAAQVYALSDHIKNLLIASFKGAEAYGKNGEAVKKN